MADSDLKIVRVRIYKIDRLSAAAALQMGRKQSIGNEQVICVGMKQRYALILLYDYLRDRGLPVIIKKFVSTGKLFLSLEDRMYPAIVYMETDGLWGLYTSNRNFAHWLTSSIVYKELHRALNPEQRASVPISKQTMEQAHPCGKTTGAAGPAGPAGFFKRLLHSASRILRKGA